MKVYEKIDGNWNIQFIYSPMFEMLCSLHVLSKPEHHLERLQWARDMESKMEKQLYKEIMYFGFNFAEWCSVMDFDSYSEEFYDLNMIHAIEVISRLDIVSFVYTMLHEKFSRENISYCLLNKSSCNLDVEPGQTEIFINPENLRSRLISCLKEYYYLYFEKELRFIEPLLVRVLKRQAEYYDLSGTREYVKNLHNRIEVADDAFYFHKYKLFTVPFNNIKTIVFMPSSFADPHLLIGIKNSSTLQLTIRAHLSCLAEEVPLDLYKTMKALGDETRLRILRSVSIKDSSTQSLAKELNLTEACISKHLKVLHDADILYKQRKGNYIYYILNRTVLDKIPMDIYEYLDGGKAI